jgi:hypothetical protein
MRAAGSGKGCLWKGKLYTNRHCFVPLGLGACGLSASNILLPFEAWSQWPDQNSQTKLTGFSERDRDRETHTEVKAKCTQWRGCCLFLIEAQRVELNDLSKATQSNKWQFRFRPNFPTTQLTLPEGCLFYLRLETQKTPSAASHPTVQPGRARLRSSSVGWMGTFSSFQL